MSGSVVTRAATLGRLGLGLALALGLWACGKKDEPSGARPEDPALSKPAEQAQPAPAPTVPQLPAPAPEQAEKPIQDAEPKVAEEEGDEADDEESEGERPAGSKKKRGKSHGPSSRKRGSSGETDNAPEARAESQALRVKRIQFSESIKGREPVEPEETFEAGTKKLYAFIELANDTKQKSKVTVTFVPPMGGATKVTLDVGDKSRWRTWALRKNPSAVGTWKVIVKDEQGRELAHRSFEVTE